MPMTALDQRPATPAAGVLQLVGIILVLTFVLDFVVRLLAFPSPPEENVAIEAQFKLLTEFIDRGVIPLIGLALFSVGRWLKQARGTTKKDGGSAWQDANFWTFVFASLLGVLFLVVIPFHYAKVGEATKIDLDKVETQSGQIELRVQQELRQLDQVKQQWQAISKDPNQVDALLQSPQLPPQERAQLQQLKQNPEQLERVAQEQLVQLERTLKQGQEQQKTFETQKAQQLDFIKTNQLMYRVRGILRSLLLTCGFAAIGWTGLRDS